MDRRPIGVFDSGVGGLTSVKELRRLLPGEDIIYFGDTGRVPYGTRSAETIKKYASQAVRYLATFDVKAILAACGTVSTNFTQTDYRELGIDVPYVTIVEPAAVEACGATRNRQVGLLATTASAESGAYHHAVEVGCPGATVTGVGCPLLVTLVESGRTDKDHPVTRPALEMYLAPIKKAQVDTLILGCTHFPLLEEGIQQILGPDVRLVDAGAAAARQMEKLLRQTGALANKSTSTVSYYVTDTVEKFASVAENFLTQDITEFVTHIDISEVDKE